MRTFGLVGLVLAVAVALYLYSSDTETVRPAGAGQSPATTIDIVGVRSDLMRFANAERQQFALEGRYLPLDDLRAKGMGVGADSRGPYQYTAEINDSSFRIVATYSGPPGANAPAVLSIGPSMQIQ